MKLLENGLTPHEDEWVSFDETETYQNYISKNSHVKSFKETMNMEMEVHNQMNINYEKTLNTVSFFTKSSLGKFSKKKKMEVGDLAKREKS